MNKITTGEPCSSSNTPIELPKYVTKEQPQEKFNYENPHHRALVCKVLRRHITTIAERINPEQLTQLLVKEQRLERLQRELYDVNVDTRRTIREIFAGACK